MSEKENSEKWMKEQWSLDYQEKNYLWHSTTQATII